MVLNSTSAFEIYKKVEKSGDKIKSPYEVISVILNQLHKNIHLMILEIDKKKAFKISRRFENLKETQKAISKYFVKCLTTIYSLQTSLDFEKGGKIATNLFQLYEFCRQQIIKGFTLKIDDGILKAIEVLIQIMEGWEEIPSDVK